MLLHRNARDDARYGRAFPPLLAIAEADSLSYSCARKYGADWIEYQRKVPYSCVRAATNAPFALADDHAPHRFIPYVL